MVVELIRSWTPRWVGLNSTIAKTWGRLLSHLNNNKPKWRFKTSLNRYKWEKDNRTAKLMFQRMDSLFLISLLQTLPPIHAEPVKNQESQRGVVVITTHSTLKRSRLTVWRQISIAQLKFPTTPLITGTQTLLVRTNWTPWSSQIVLASIQPILIQTLTEGSLDSLRTNLLILHFVTVCNLVVIVLTTTTSLKVQSIKVRSIKRSTKPSKSIWLVTTIRLNSTIPLILLKSSLTIVITRA